MLGGWPLLNGPNYKQKYSIIEKLAILKKVESSQFFEIFISTNPKDPRRSILRIAQPSWFFNKEFLLNENIMEAYKTLITNTIIYLNPLSSNLTEDIKNMLDLETQFGLVITQ